MDLFDPFRVVETGALSIPTAPRSLEEHRLESVIALGLATMAPDPNAYSVEILPAALRKRREFMGGTLWMIVAAAVAVAYLVSTDSPRASSSRACAPPCPAWRPARSAPRPWTRRRAS